MIYYIIIKKNKKKMRNVRDMQIIQIDITTQCNKSCSNCTRFCGHYAKEKIYYMDLKYIEDILISLKDYDGVVGLIGGEPTLHPQFNEICELLEKHRSIEKRGLWSNNPNSYTLNNYFTSERICVSEHKNIDPKDIDPNNIFVLDVHTPLLVSSESIKKKYNISDEEMNNYINNCWIQLLWSANINKKGAWFCEVAGMLSYLFNGPDGIDIKEHPDWWKYDLDKYQYQIDWACKKCGGAIPLHTKLSSIIEDDISEDNLEELKKLNSPKINNNKYVIYDKGFDLNIKDKFHGWNFKYIETLKNNK